MGGRRPSHFTEPQPPAFDVWDAKALAEQMVVGAFPGAAFTCTPGAEPVLWVLNVEGRGEVGHVERVVLNRPVWASEAFGVEVTLGVLESDDVAPARQHAHGASQSASHGASQSASRERTEPMSPGWRVRALPTTPAAEFDLALIVPDGVTAAAVEAALRAAAGELLERVVLFDEFRGSGVAVGTRSLAWRLTFRHPERTLREKEIEGRRARLLDTLDKELGIRPRAT